MSDIGLVPVLLREAGNSCEALVAVQVDVAERALADAEGAPGAARMGGMASAESARLCIDGWQTTLGRASRAMHDLSTKLGNTAAAVRTADHDSVGRYLGPVQDVPDITLNINR